MRHLLTSILALHWAVVFAVLAMVCALGDTHGVIDLLALTGATASPPYLQSLDQPILSAAIAAGFVFLATLFFWAFISSAIGHRSDREDTQDVLRIAFASAIGVLTAFLGVSLFLPFSGLLSVVATHLGSMLVSYLAIQAELHGNVAEAEEDVRTAARVMALGAVHSSMLARLSGRSGNPGEGH